MGKKRASRPPPIYSLYPSTLPAGPLTGALRLFRRPVMTKKKAKASARASRTKAAIAKTSVTKRSAAPAGNGAAALIVLGFDDEQKPRGARFDHDKPDLVTKAAELMGFKAFQASLPDVAEVAKKLPLGRLYANGRGFVPNIRQSLYTDVVAELAFEPQ